MPGPPSRRLQQASFQVHVHMLTGDCDKTSFTMCNVSVSRALSGGGACGFLFLCLFGMVPAAHASRTSAVTSDDAGAGLTSKSDRRSPSPPAAKRWKLS
jgi:hypothetical protein